MASQATPEPVNQPGPLPEPTNQPISGSTERNNDRVVELQQSVIRESAERIRKLEQELAERNAPPPEPPPTAEDFFKDPHKNIGRIIDERLRTSVAPLLTDMASVRSEREYQRLKNLVRQDPMGSKVLPIVESNLDSLAADMITRGQEITNNWMLPAIKLLYAEAVINDPTKVVGAAAPPPPPPTRSSVTPPNIPSNSGRPIEPSSQGDPELEARNKLTELEVRLAREFYGNDRPFQRYLASRDSGDNSNDGTKGSFMILESERKRSR